MTDKVQKIREEVERIQLYTQSEVLKQVLDYIDEVQKEEIPPKFPLISSKEELKQKPFKVEKDKWYVCIKDYHDKNCTFTKGKKYKSDKDGFLVDDEDKDTFERKIWEEDACEYFRPIKCMYTEYNYTDEDRKVLCDGCEEECEYAQKAELVSEDLDKAALQYFSKHYNTSIICDWEAKCVVRDFKAGAKWQKEQMTKDAFVFEGKHDTACVLASECLRNHGWFQRERDFNDLWRYISTVKELFTGEFHGIGKTKIVVVKDK